MTPKQQANIYGIESLAPVAASAGYTTRGLSGMHYSNPDRFKLICMGYIATELKLTAEQMRAAKILLKGGKL